MKIVSYALMLLFFLSCCSQKERTEVHESCRGAVVAHPAFSSDSAYSYIQEQCGFGPRTPNAESHDQCAAYLKDKLERFGCQTIIQTFSAQAYDGTMLNGTNIIGRSRPEIDKRVALFAHWDTRPFSDNDQKHNWHKPVMGANDGASGVAVLLEVARQMQLRNDSIGVDIVFLDLEDYGQPSFEMKETEDSWCLGAQYLSHNFYSGVKPQKGILLDMVGAKNPCFAYDHVSVFFAEQLLQEVWSVAKSLGYSSSFVVRESGGIIDDHYYINKNARIPTVDVIDFDAGRGFPDTWHTQNDTPENIDKASLQMVGEVVLTYLREKF